MVQKPKIKHRHCDMITSVINDMNLSVFVCVVSHTIGGGQTVRHERWLQSDIGSMANDQRDNYFVCLPQHEESCIHWLNGGNVQSCRGNSIWNDVLEKYGPDNNWHVGHLFMQENVQIRIKKDL
ncbi:hypothetical protein Va1_147 [Vibrio phage Va1]|nr:hypothetical protein Va1_147 [Vibrio phage Va1]